MGAPRSGTTLLAGMLSSNKNVIALPEMKYIHEILDLDLYEKEKVVHILKNHFMFIDLKIIENENNLYNIVSSNLKKTTFNIINLFNKKHRNKKTITWVEHTPNNFLYFNKLKEEFPNAKFIHLVRDGRAVYSSTKIVDWGYKDVITGAKNWNFIINKCLTLEKQYEDLILNIRYEDLTSQPKETILKICKFAQIKYSDEMLISNGLITPSYAKKSYISKIGTKTTESSQYEWIKKLKKYEIEYFTFYNYDYLNFYNYDTKNFKAKDLSKKRKQIISTVGEYRQKKSIKNAQKRFNSVF